MIAFLSRSMLRLNKLIMLDTQTKRRIDDCRDILVGKLPDPKAQIEQITIGLIYKFMDDMDKEAVELGGQSKFFSDYKVPDPEFPNDRKKDKVIEFSKYAWDKLMHPKVTATEMLTLYSEAIEGMEKNPNIPQLFRDIFNNAYLPYRDPETLKMFLKTIGEFEYTHSEKLGDAFEYLLSVMGSQGDAGQFRTPRHIIDFLVAIIDPDKSATILDPACGTAGFLISAYKHILLKYSSGTDKAGNVSKRKWNIYEYNKLEKKPFNNLGDQLTPDDRKKLIQNFVGYDISPDMVRLSLVNLYLHGFNTPNIHEYDTLSSEERWNESYDVILANPPFMSPKGGIRPHKKFTISSNRSEVLFVDYIAEHLNPNGKAGIIVPEGIIFQSGTAYKDLRKMLVENHLYAVVSLPAGVFNPYSGVKTSILLMDKDIARQREEILFIKIDNDGYNLGAQRTAVKGGQLEEAIKLAHAFVATGDFEETTIAHLVPKTEIAKNGDYNLSGERYKIGEISNSDFEIVSLVDVCFKITDGSHFSPETTDVGFPYITVRDLNDGIIDFVNCKKINDQSYHELVKNGCRPINNDLLFSKDGTVGKTALVKFEKDFVVLSSLAIIRPNLNKILPEYLFIIASSEPFIQSAIDNKTGVAIKRIVLKTLKQIQIPLPPLSIQEEIVAEIEGYQKIIDGAKAVVANYKPKIDIDPDWEMVELGEVGKVSMCKRVFKEQTTVIGDIPFYKIGTFGKEPDAFISNELFSEYRNKFSYPKEGEVLISTSGTIGRTVVFDGNPAYFQDSNIVWIENDESKVLNSFLNIYYQMIKWRPAEGVTIARLYNKIIEETTIPIPPLDSQRQIVSQIEKEQELVNANKQLIEIFEQKIKDRIATVWGEEKAKDEPGVRMAAEPDSEYVKKKTTQ